MNKTRLTLAVLVAVVVVETAVIAFPVLSIGSAGSGRGAEFPAGPPQVTSFPSSVFNEPQSNDTDYTLNPTYEGSWMMTVQSSLVPSNRQSVTTEAQVALAPAYPSENLSIPTIIVQERADGLLRVEYYAQNWKNTFGLVLYNSTSPGWERGENLTLRFTEFGAPSGVNPQLAPRPNGNITISVGRQVVLSDYPIAWANLSMMFLYGYPGSSFQTGSLRIVFQGLAKKS